ncbi:LPXTG cell wall anchor domain-containing protein [Staphylococcus haemolyticus]|uniref:LPXTG cell wall anchor domain-containing protein n=1 Tax=Staphylococcus haemolyticus TaxID=1283 RepID=UPI00069D7B7A|nr:LPXTG cell wall anchor domain-containing protein [Staphylococcus haemolyticus]
MKKSKVLATTTLAGSLLFTGVGATHNAHAADYVNDSNVRDYAKNAIGSKYTEAGSVSIGGHGGGVTDKDNGVKDNGDYYTVIFSGEKDNGVGAAKVYKDGRIEAQTPRDANNVLTIDAPNNTQSTDNNQAATNNNTTTATTDNDVSTQENNTQSTQTKEAQTTKALPETGEQSNSGLATIIASVLLAAGSLLAFRRTSNSK